MFEGAKPFLLGDSICEDDCGIFGLMAQFYWHTNGYGAEPIIRGKGGGKGGQRLV